MSPAAIFGARQRKQYISPGWQLCLFLIRRASRKTARSGPRISIGRLSSRTGSPALIHSRNGIFVNAKQTGNLFDRVVAVYFHLAVVGVAFGHASPTQPSYERLPASPPDRELRSPISLLYVQRSGPLLHWKANLQRG